MKYKRSLTIMLVSILLITSISTIGSARFSILSSLEDNTFQDTGVIERQQITSFVSSSKDVYLIAGDTGITFMKRLFKKYLPVNLDQDFKVDGMEVEFTAKIAIREIFSITGLVSLKYKALPIEIIEIHEKSVDPDPDDEIKLSFDIEIVKENKLGEPIPVTVILENIGTKPVRVSEMALVVGTLDFTIKTPSGTTLTFNQSRLERDRRDPIAVPLEPGKPYLVSIEDITEPGLFVNELVSNFVFNEGTYNICGHYESGKQSSVEETEDILECKLDSKVHLFSIADGEEPENIDPVAVPSVVSEGVVGQEITLDGSESYDPDGTIEQYYWSCTNGVIFPYPIGYGKILTYVFEHPGVYNVVLEVTDDKGATNKASTNVTIIDEQEPQLAIISGMVTGGTYLPLAFPIGDATIVATSLNSEDQYKQYETTTDAFGNYELKVDAGSYKVTVSKEGYYTSSKEVVVGPGDKKIICFNLKRIQDPELAVIAGRVIEHPDLPIFMALPVADATVVATSLDDLSEKQYQTTTDALGNYELTIDPGSYKVTVSKEGYHTSSKEVVIGPGENKAVYFNIKRIQARLTFDIVLESDIYKINDPITVVARLTNDGEQTVTVNEMCLGCKTLDFVMVTPDKQKIHYIGPKEDGLPNPVEINPGESYEVPVVITDEEFGNREEVYDFTTPGRYSIIGLYNSRGPDTNMESVIYQGFIFSSLKYFEIEDELVPPA